MKRLAEIGINRFQLNILLDKGQKEGFEHITGKNVYCSKCQDTCVDGVDVTRMLLDALNDVRAEGICEKCRGKVARVLEFGEDKAFYDRANKLRKSV